MLKIAVVIPLDINMFKEIEEKSIELKNLMVQMFPDSCSSIFINVWEDGDYRVQCRYGTSLDNIYSFTYHKFEDNIVFKEEQKVYYSMSYDEFGNTFYIEDKIEEIDE